MRFSTHGGPCKGRAVAARDEDDMWFSAHLALKGIRRFVIGAALGVQARGSQSRV